MRFLWAISFVLTLVLTRNAYPTFLSGLKDSQISVTELAASYDYIIVGGGQSGLVIGNRLSDDPTKTVLIVEYGYFNDDPAQIEPSSGTIYKPANLFNVTSVPQPGLNNRTSNVFAAAVVGGGSTVNGMLFQRGAAEDYDNWAKLGNEGWDFESLLPYFKKATSFTPPSHELAAKHNITWNASAYGDGPINATYPPWVWPTQDVQFDGWRELGVTVPTEAALGKSYGAFWVPSNLNPSILTRSYARNGYFDPVSARPNLQLIVGHRVNEIQFDAERRAESVTIQARDAVDVQMPVTVKASREIMLCAGWLHTPQILQRSGIGPRKLLEEAGIEVLVDLPGVGSNLQDHPVTGISYTYQNDLIPNPTSLQTNTTFAQWASQEWLEHRGGPLSLATGNALATLPLPLFDPNYQAVIEKTVAQDAATYLPHTYTTTNIAGFHAQRSLLLKSLTSLENGFTEITFGGHSTSSLTLEKPLSRGTILLNTTSIYAEPVVDFNTNINPVDTDIFVAMIKYHRTWAATDSLQTLQPVETSPGVNVTGDVEIGAYVTGSMGSTEGHSCGTAAMMPRELGGVVSSELLVYGVQGLSVGDISIIPMIPGAHTCATVYAIAEKAADMIKARAEL